MAGKLVELQLTDTVLFRDTSVPFRVEQFLDGRLVSAAPLNRRLFTIEPPAPGQFVLAISYALGQHPDDSYSTQLAPCRKTEIRTWTVVAPREQAASVRVADWPESVEFEILTRAYGTDDCSYEYASAPLTLTIRQVGRPWRLVATAEDACYGWSHASRSRLFRNGRFTVFKAGWPHKGSASRAYRYTVREKRLKKVLARGTIKARQIYHRAERIYAWLPGGRVNDSYWNICVREGLPIAMHNGNAYCNVGGYYERTLRIVRRR